MLNPDVCVKTGPTTRNKLGICINNAGLHLWSRIKYNGEGITHSKKTWKTTHTEPSLSRKMRSISSYRIRYVLDQSVSCMSPPSIKIWNSHW